MNTVTLTIKGKLPTQPLQLSISAGAVVDANGQLIDGNDDGQPGGNFQATFGKAGLKLASVSAAGVVRPISARALHALVVPGHPDSASAIVRS